MTFSDETFASNANRVMIELEALGYERVRVINSFRDGSSYKGVNTTFKTPEGQLFELQFHTPESFNVKQNISHVLYEEMRLLPRTDPRWLELDAQLKAIASQIPIPPGVKDIRNVR